jgi:four helix bundle protein
MLNGKKMKKQTYDLEERLLEYSVRIIKIVEQLPNTRAGNHVAGQLLKSGTSPYPNHGEAQAAESPKDFIHKLRISLKELRDSRQTAICRIRFSQLFLGQNAMIAAQHTHLGTVPSNLDLVYRPEKVNRKEPST